MQDITWMGEALGSEYILVKHISPQLHIDNAGRLKIFPFPPHPHLDVKIVR